MEATLKNSDGKTRTVDVNDSIFVGNDTETVEFEQEVTVVLKSGDGKEITETGTKFNTFGRTERLVLTE